MKQYLFVYGTLLSGTGHAVAKRLASEAQLIGPAWTPGRLYDLGKWPGLRPSAIANERVFGELHLLDTPASSFVWLDHYEGLAAEQYPLCEYLRVPRHVRLIGGDVYTAWVYSYQRQVEDVQRILSGRWLDRDNQAAA